MSRNVMICVALVALLGWPPTAHAVNFFWTGPGLGGPGGNFQMSQNWTFTPPPFPLIPAPGGADDTVNFDLGRSPENRYTVTNVHGENDRLIVHDDSLTLVVAESVLGNDYVLLNDTNTSPSLTIGVALGDVADVILQGATSLASISTQATTIGRAAFSAGILTVDDLHWFGDGDLMVGESGSGTMTIQNGAEVTSDHGSLGLNEGVGFFGSGTVLVTGADSTWTNSDELHVGVEGSGTLTIESGGRVSDTIGRIGVEAGATGTVTVTGADSTWHNSNGLGVFVGDAGDGTLMIADGGRVVSGQAIIASEATSTGTATVTGDDSTWTTVTLVTVGDAGDGTLMISGGGRVTTQNGLVGAQSGSTGMATVTGAGATWGLAFSLDVGDEGDGTLTISEGASVTADNGVLGAADGSTGVATVTGANSTWAIDFTFLVGDEGSGELTISDGGHISNNFGFIGEGFDSTGTATVTGEGSTWTNAGQLFVGSDGMGTLTVEGGGSVANTVGSVGGNPAGIGTATVNGAGSTWNNSGLLLVGGGGDGTLDIEAGGSVSSTSGFIARHAGSAGTVTVSGAGSNWIANGRLSIAGNVSTGLAGGTGTLNIQTGAEVDIAEDTVMFPNGLLRLQGGMLATTEISFEGGGQFHWTSGTLHVGIYNGDLTNPTGGTLAPGRSAGGTTILGNYTQSAGATLEIEIGGTATATQFDFVDVNGTATLGGELQLALINGFVPSSDDEFVIFNADEDLLSFFTNAGNGQRLDTIDGFGSFLVHYGPTSPFNANQIVLSEFVPAVLPGDYNENGIVDSADYVVWRKSAGIVVEPFSGADGDGSGIIDDGDFAVWRANFGNLGGNGTGLIAANRLSAAAPEPPTAVLLMFAAIFFCHGRDRSGRGSADVSKDGRWAKGRIMELGEKRAYQ